jgi:glycosyltransferase involved in cell wall biosynthesis
MSKNQKILFIQPTIPHYNIEFFRMLSDHCDLSILSSNVAEDGMNTTSSLSFLTLKKSSMLSFFGIQINLSLFNIFYLNKFDKIVVNANPRDITQLLVTIFFSRKTYSWGMFHRIGANRLVGQFCYLIYSYFSRKVFVYGKPGYYNLKSIGVNQKKLKIVGNGLPISPVYRDKRIEGDTIALLQVVRLNSIKNPMFILNFLHYVNTHSNNNYKVHLTIVGTGPHLSQMESYVIENNLSEFVLFKYSIYDEDVLKDLYFNADFAVVPSCAGLSIHHALSYSTPFITDDNLHTQASEFDILIDGVNSIIYRSGSVEDLYNKLDSLRGEQEYYSSLRRSAYFTAVANSVSLKANNFMEVLIDD